MIRISSQQIFSGGINRLQDLNSSLNQTQEQISTGKRVNKPSDDPVAAARILKLDQELSRIETYQRNAGLAENRLQQEESALASSVDIIQRVRELTVQAGNGSLSANDRQSISSEIKERLGQLANVANTRDASGEYIFSGFQGSTAAFGKDASGSWVYQGDEGQRVLEIDDGVTVPISDHGKGIFESVASTPTFSAEVAPGDTSGASISSAMVVNQEAFDAFYNGNKEDLVVNIINGTPDDEYQIQTPAGATLATGTYEDSQPIQFNGIQFEISDGVPGSGFVLKTSEKQSVFSTMETLVNGLDNIDKSSPEGQTAYDDLIATSLQNLDNAQESILQKQTELGGRLNAVESTSSFLEDSSVYSKEIRSELQDVDYAEAISNLSFQSFVLQAAQQSFAQVSKLSLFDRL
ncbi:flagellar hook-associated protein 3 [Marinobacter vulgaris]|uniref:Flagellar hook-associated protein 3 n=1 Tax=Marinobacter vulgaris TaxID=1928331 RepID=A0A2V3ZL73_9GAMM|nr:flagellar hook-associated protein FlgL [Marinobacter vulgaris]PXX91675.1 flagellar hook-associated protein 3 [Marinobacter vulgaris]TSJ70820.1 flagellar hook-associated protein 3 [Marinobacter vulgaris]